MAYLKNNQIKILESKNNQKSTVQDINAIKLKNKNLKKKIERDRKRKQNRSKQFQDNYK